MIAILTVIPSIHTKKTFPGCKKSFFGYPLSDDDTDIAAVKYLACIAYKIRGNIGPWRILLRKKQEVIQKKLMAFLQTKIVVKDFVKNLIKRKKEYSMQPDLIPNEHNIQSWTTFLPPMRELNIPKVRRLSPSFHASFNANLKKGNIEQFNQISTILGKILYFSLSIQEAIQEIIEGNEPILPNQNDMPFLENVCCNTGEKNVLKYFIDIDPSIGVNNERVHELNNIYIKFKTLSKSAILYNPDDTRIIYPKLKESFSEETIYKAFLHYCVEPLSDDLSHFCIDSSIIDGDTFEEKVQKLKEEGKSYTEKNLVALLSIIGKKNYIENETNDDMIHMHQELINTLEHLRDADETDIPEILITKLLSLTDSFDVLDWKDAQEDETTIVDEVRNYLRLSIFEMQKELLEFLKKEAGLTTRKYNKIETFLTTLKDWDLRGNNIYMEADDETAFTMFSFFKQATIDILKTFPTIIINKVNYKKVRIPKQWGLKNKHNSIIQKHIKNEFNDSTNEIHFSSFYNDDLNFVLKNIKKDIHILLLMNKTPFFAKNEGKDTIFDSTILKEIGEFYFLLALTKYIRVIEEEEGEEEKIYSMDEEHPETIERKISRLLVTYINLLIERKKTLNKNMKLIQDNVLKAKVKETAIITKSYKDLTNEERKIGSIHQNLKLGKWKLGLTKAVHKYSSKQFDKEVTQILEQAKDERKRGENDEITQQLSDVLSMEDIHDMDMQARREAAIAVQMSLLGDDDDHGEGDGDELF